MTNEIERNKDLGLEGFVETVATLYGNKQAGSRNLDGNLELLYYEDGVIWLIHLDGGNGQSISTFKQGEHYILVNPNPDAPTLRGTTTFASQRGFLSLTFFETDGGDTALDYHFTEESLQTFPQSTQPTVTC